MASLFTGRVLLANRERDELDTERELHGALDNRVLLLYFGSARCPRCRRFAPLLKDFFLRLTDDFHVERASQLGLVYVSRDETEEQRSAFLRAMPRRWLALPFGDAFGRELELRFAVSEVPAVVVLKPSGEVIVGNAVEEIRSLGPACFRNWQEAAELVDRDFLLAEDWEKRSRRSITDPLRRLKYRLDKGKEAKDREREEDLE
ncbi:nucleoredoxin-like protein 1 [Neopsephotus bourkii]|uniref:nucleoredoxin-like protein 1 n=1 Tax=Neopsephotus bourkii TaxID=309878 RepID=UPI002AA57316|nr:nucleoredoxin-like protein 1 [Neopsephotus bourkii]